MLCLRCTRRIALTPSSSSMLSKSSTSTGSLLQSTITRAAQVSNKPTAAVQQQAQRQFSSFSNIRSTFTTQKRPTLAALPTHTPLSLATVLENPGGGSSVPAVSGPGSLLQSRGPKRDTFDPSHRVRKRRHGFLCRLKSRNGRNLLKRRRLKRRSTLGH